MLNGVVYLTKQNIFTQQIQIGEILRPCGSHLPNAYLCFVDKHVHAHYLATTNDLV